MPKTKPETTLTAQSAKALLKSFATPESVETLSRFFKTGRGEYGEGDRFLGVKVPNTRFVAKRFRNLPLSECELMLHSRFHEERLLALLILNLQFEKASEIEKRKIYSLYLKNLAFVNNWDLVDTSAPLIIGAFLFDKSRLPLYRLAKSKGLWERRVAIMSTFYFIKSNDFDDAFAISEILLHDEHDLIHKAVGWMLREIGNRDLVAEELFLRTHYKSMPRTMLRYALEKLPEARRRAFLKGDV